MDEDDDDEEEEEVVVVSNCGGRGESPGWSCYCPIGYPTLQGPVIV